MAPLAPRFRRLCTTQHTSYNIYTAQLLVQHKVQHSIQTTTYNNATNQNTIKTLALNQKIIIKGTIKVLKNGCQAETCTAASKTYFDSIRSIDMRGVEYIYVTYIPSITTSCKY